MAYTTQPPAPFTCSYSPNIPEFFNQAGCTLVISTYQAGKVIFLSALDDERLIQLPRNFTGAMALGVKDSTMAVSEGGRVVVLKGDKGLATGYPRQPGVYETLFVPRNIYFTGQINLHALEWGEAGLYGMNTQFSCICTIDDEYSFTPYWTPPNISKLVPEDRCHLNGMAMENGRPAFATAFNTGDSKRSWKEGLPGGGVLFHVDSGEVLLEDLQMPHTPRLWDGKLYMLLSATGELICADPETRSYDLVRKIGGFVRGMAKFGDFVFVAYSRLRQNSSVFARLDIDREHSRAGVDIIHLPTAAKVGEIRYETSVDEIFDLLIIPDTRRAGIINGDSELANKYVLTDSTSYWVNTK